MSTTATPAALPTAQKQEPRPRLTQARPSRSTLGKYLAPPSRVPGTFRSKQIRSRHLRPEGRPGRYLAPLWWANTSG
jgi:hypothetical protein